MKAANQRGREKLRGVFSVVRKCGKNREMVSLQQGVHAVAAVDISRPLNGDQMVYILIIYF